MTACIYLLLQLFAILGQALACVILVTATFRHLLEYENNQASF